MSHLAERPASNERSPNRKPRWKQPTAAVLKAKEQETFLRAYVLLGWEGACAAIGKTKVAVLHWASENPGFLQRWHKAKEQRQKLLEPRLDDMTDASLTVVEGILASNDKKLRALALDAAKTHLKGTGVYRDKRGLEVAGKDGKPIEILVRWDGNKYETHNTSEAAASQTG